MNGNEKMPGEERRELILATLQKADRPMTGKELGELTNVSRQVIVGDITLLKAKNEPIIATSQGYLYMHAPVGPGKIEKTLVCQHGPEQTEEELNILVDHGLTVKDVKIEHPVYGDLSASIMVSNRQEVKEFIRQVQEANAVYLSKLAEEGIHLHTVIAETEQQIEKAKIALKQSGILVE
ncbi:transcription repressor NadR [Sporosarcina thermotolerans]|uniref:Transcription repressor NadR n=1 Tax=Sporosarcina thermotolerans TaxID=633404 RepID=A0AAW9A4E1_9BACL|nr:transcription repressor NadR [Sporosarcina thermotolerans]MDW0115505.1 transcription repressor NadR [Sporosarcina thermotolerans]WHT47173.1 transcription repressor NadR [Sporosarcina thermotolerans]